MNEERLKEIKDNIDFQFEIVKAKGYNKEALLFTDEELELYNEVIRLKEENEKIRKQNMYEHKYCSDMEDKYIVEKSKNDKAIEYVENNDFGIVTFSDRDINGNLVRKIEKGYVKKDDLLNILKEK